MLSKLAAIQEQRTDLGKLVLDFLNDNISNFSVPLDDARPKFSGCQGQFLVLLFEGRDHYLADSGEMIDDNVNPLIHNVGDPLHDPPSHQERWILLHLLMNKEAHIPLDVLTYD